MKKIAVIGAGSWGTALAITLSNKGHDVRITDVDKAHLESLKENRENLKYLPGIKFADTLVPVDSTEEAMKDADVVLFSAPAQHFRSALKGALEYLTDDMIIVNVAKGIEQHSLMTMSQIAEELGVTKNYVVFQGPSHAEEVGIGLPTTVVAASKDNDKAVEIQNIFATDFLRVYTGEDVIGVELGGALKNIIALGAGISDGMGFGDNAKAAMMTRGIAEMKRLGAKMGADVNTFSGLTGIGDLIVTCTSMHSRNRRCGIMIGEGMDPQQAVKEVGMVVEGMFTAEAAYELAKKLDVEMPITNEIYKLVQGEINGKEAVMNLMGRSLKPELGEDFDK